jgi:type VI secretion system protein ImpF
LLARENARFDERVYVMAELTTKERLQPSLLDRLTDTNPDQRVESREARVMNEAQLRECVRRDLAWLMNTTHMAAVQELDPESEVSRSVVNFGICDLAGQTLSGIDRLGLERLIREAIWNYEPRLLRESVRLELSTDDSRIGQNSLLFDIQAELWAQPTPVALYLRTEIDLENGSVKVEELRGGSG